MQKLPSCRIFVEISGTWRKKRTDKGCLFKRVQPVRAFLFSSSNIIFIKRMLFDDRYQFFGIIRISRITAILDSLGRFLVSGCLQNRAY